MVTLMERERDAAAGTSLRRGVDLPRVQPGRAGRGFAYETRQRSAKYVPGASYQATSPVKHRLPVHWRFLPDRVRRALALGRWVKSATSIRYLVAPRPTLEVARKAEAFSEFVHHELKGTPGLPPGQYARAALSNIQAEAEALHGAAISLCGGGWASLATILLRTSTDLLASALVLTHAGNSADLQGFKYLYGFLREAARDSSLPSTKRKEHTEELLKRISVLGIALQPEAKAWAFQGKKAKFWYGDDFSGPSSILEKYGGPEYGEFFQTLSSPAHGGFLGLRLFRDDPDSLHPFPRRDPIAQGSILVISSWLLVVIAQARASFHCLGVEGIFQKLQDEQRRVLVSVRDQERKTEGGVAPPAPGS
jgi:hypothetical protein